MVATVGSIWSRSALNLLRVSVELLRVGDFNAPAEDGGRILAIGTRLLRAAGQVVRRCAKNLSVRQ